MSITINGVAATEITDVQIAPSQPNGPRTNAVYEGRLIGDVSGVGWSPFELEYDGRLFGHCRLTNTPHSGSFKYGTVKQIGLSQQTMNTDDNPTVEIKIIRVGYDELFGVQKTQFGQFHDYHERYQYLGDYLEGEIVKVKLVYQALYPGNQWAGMSDWVAQDTDRKTRRVYLDSNE